MFKKKPIIYIHIGTAKTGTTAIQNFIAKNEKLLLKMGYYYPKTGLSHNCHHGLAFNWEKNESFNKIFNVNKTQIDLLIDDLQKIAIRTLLLAQNVY